VFEFIDTNKINRLHHCFNSSLVLNPASAGFFVFCSFSTTYPARVAIMVYWRYPRLYLSLFGDE
ncbi:hypothetical protein, partial [Salmonella enterica]